jgi:hypothetical protein
MTNDTLMIEGYVISTEARLVRTGIFSGVFHVLTLDDGRSCEPPVVVIAPGQWKVAEDAHKAAAEYAAVMVDDGALRSAIAARDVGCSNSSV